MRGGRSPRLSRETADRLRVLMESVCDLPLPAQAATVALAGVSGASRRSGRGDGIGGTGVPMG